MDVLRKYFRGIAIQIYNLHVMFDPERIDIGSGISGHPLTIRLIQKRLDEIYKEVWPPAVWYCCGGF